MGLSRSGRADAEAARRRLERLTGELTAVGEDHGPSAPAPAEPASRGGRHAARSTTSLGRLGDRLADALPPTLAGRFGVTSQHVTVVALVVATALALAAWWVIQSRPEPVDALPVVSTPPDQAPPDAGPTGDSGADPAQADNPAAGQAADPTGAVAEVVVHVAGKVRRPGIVTLPAGARVIDALQAAGGPRRGVDLVDLNLARLVADGEQILVGVAPPPGAPAAGAPGGGSGSAAPAAPVNLNTATSEQLEELPGIGPVTAAAILEWRAEHGRFSTVEELLEVSGIGDATLAQIRDLVTV